MLDRNGFQRKTYDDLLTEMSAKAQELYGADANVGERSFLGILLRIMAWFMSLAWMAIEQVYHAAFRKSAEGVQLDKLLPYAGITRNLEEYAYGQITLQGTPHYTVESGFLVGKTKSDITYETLGSVTLDAIGQGTVDIVCTEVGSVGNTPAGTITEIINPSADVESVTNEEKVDGGREKETDAEARTRSNITVEGMGNGTPAAIRRAILTIPSVRAAQVIENYKDEVDQYNTPSRGIQAFVLGGQEEDIGMAILNSKAGGINPYGTTTVTVNDDSGNPQIMRFTRATEVTLYAKVNISTNTSFEIDGQDKVKNALVQYVGGTDTNTQLYAGLNMGEKVVMAKGMFAILQVPGVTDVELKLSTDGMNFIEENITVAINEVAQIDAANIEVTIDV
ncbi:baseplate J/gp47 family protein [Metasolibacillus sp.]|uniref:baseplate J/gp47 family protein n=1 Tax=Metasolibacillus sp. TaxID=2703680 RepID=UPI0025D3B9CD|nr:baseplate J/gp47 family protein [Metasolibacillus sp.]MCT6926176.1 baseplate J/gp47 family protein [Metasolibacillus sp.]MCT6942391.1 baseplate J/gp47 family protein [Metasolibacillus sp.]